MGAAESEIHARLAALEVQEAQTNNMAQYLCRAVDSNFTELETRLEARLNEADRQSGIQELFGGLEVATQMADTRLRELQARLDSLEASGSAGAPPSVDGVLRLLSRPSRARSMTSVRWPLVLSACPRVPQGIRGVSVTLH